MVKLPLGSNANNAQKLSLRFLLLIKELNLKHFQQ
jgi:hypothetical protein